MYTKQPFTFTHTLPDDVYSCTVGHRRT